jgi:hypothetical protein
MTDFAALGREMTIRMNTVEAMDNAGYTIDQNDLDRISELATLLSTLAPQYLDSRW